MKIYEAIKSLVKYGIEKDLIKPEDEIYTINILLEMLGLSEYEEPITYSKISSPGDLEKVLNTIIDYQIDRGIIEDSIVFRDLFDTKIMNTLVPKPSQVIRSFWEKYNEDPQKATDYYYDLSKNSDYIRTYRVAKDKKWITKTLYGDIDITINLSKPEKDPKTIALEKTMNKSNYPKCLLCMENEGYAGRINHPARENHRIIPIQIDGQRWGFQYSPYVYYNEHCIVFNGEHLPMQINRNTFIKLFDFIKLFPHYFVGSNADLPIVGGSILSHDHFQGGHYTFAMEKAPMEENIIFKGYEDIEAGIVKWPMSVIRLRGKDSNSLVDLADKILNTWKDYTDEASFIYAYTDGEPHNTITPIARMRGDKYELDLVLRNNITTEEHPMGVYHPWEEYHNIKKENIGLIEVMGLAVLPSRLLEEMDLIGKALVNKEDISKNPKISKHESWVKSFIGNYNIITENNVEKILQDEVGNTFKEILECAGVYKRTAVGKNGFLRFIEHVNNVNEKEC